MSGPGATVRFTYQDYLNLPEESRYEILDGDLQMSPSPTARHQEIAGALYRQLAQLVERERAGRVFIAPLDVILSDADVVQPDVLFISKERESIVRERIFGAPDLVIEVLSPATAERDRTTKAKIYARAGVREMRLVDPAAKTIEILALGAAGFSRASLASSGQTAASRLLPSFSVRVDEIV